MTEMNLDEEKQEKSINSNWCFFSSSTNFYVYILNSLE